MKKLTYIITFLPYFLFSQSAWVKQKGDTYLQLSYNT